MAETVLLCLLSAQHMPNLLSVHHYKPDRLVLIETKHMQAQNRANCFLEALELGGLDYGHRCDIEALEKEDDLAAMRDALRVAYGKHSTAHWIANITGGTKPMSIATFEFFNALTGKVIYTNAARPDEFIPLQGGESECGQRRVSIGEFLAGYGFEISKKDNSIKRAEERVKAWAELALAIAEEAPAQPLLMLSDKERNQARQKGIEVTADKLSPPNEKCADLMRKKFALQGSQGELAGTLDKYQVRFLTGEWLEVFFWDLLRRHADALGAWDVRLGLEVRGQGQVTGNELDVSFMHSHALHMIECKSGGQEHDADGAALYKVEAVIRQTRALRVKSYLATTGANVLGANGLKPHIQDRADTYGCTIIPSDAIRALAAATDPSSKIQELLFNRVAR